MASDSIIEQAIDEKGSVTVDASEQVVTKSQNNRRDFLRKAQRDLDEKEISSLTSSRFLISEIERLDDDCKQLHSFRERFYEIRTKYEIVRNRAKNDSIIDILCGICLAVGSAGIGAAPSYISATSPTDGPSLPLYGWVFFGFSVILVLVGIFPKVLSAYKTLGEGEKL